MSVYFLSCCPVQSGMGEAFHYTINLLVKQGEKNSTQMNMIISLQMGEDIANFLREEFSKIYCTSAVNLGDLSLSIIKT